MKYSPLLLMIVLAAALAPAPAQEKDKDKDKKAPEPTTPVEALKPFVDKKAVAGAVMVVADKDKILAVDAVGFADIESSKMMGPETMFWIASQSKPITAAALMLLVDEGKVKLDDPIEKYLPEFKDLVVKPAEKDGKPAPPKRQVTVRDCLTHLSGMAFKSKEEDPTLDLLSLKDAVLSYAKAPLEHEPGSKFLYSNCGINTAGRIIEVVSGMPFEEFVEKRLFGPCEMTETTFWPTKDQEARIATLYTPSKDKEKGLEPIKIGYLKYPFSDKKRHIMPAGGYFSTANDVAKFCQMFLGNGTYKGKRVLSEASVKEMTRRQTPETMPQKWGLGWTVDKDYYGHGGALSTNMGIDSKRGIATVFLVQHTGLPKEPNQAVAAQTAFRKVAEAKYGPK